MSVPQLPAQIVADLKSPRHDIKIRGAQELLGQVNLMYRELQPDKFTEYYQAINHRIAQLCVISSEVNEKIGGIVAIEQLISFDGDDNAQKTTRFAAYLRAALRFNDNEVLVYAARALGRLCIPGGSLTAELVESEVQTALEWLTTDRQESRRFAAVLEIRELARNAPTLLYASVPQILDNIWIALHDIKVLIRETASEAVSSCFEILLARDSNVRTQWFAHMYEDAVNGLKAGSLEYVHGSMLIIKDLLISGGMFMHEHYREACEIALQLKSHRDIKIRSEVVHIIPILASYAPHDFVQQHLHKFMVFLQGQLKKDKERSASFIAIGRIATAITSNIIPYLDSILLAIKEGLKQRLRSKDKDGAIFQCISMLASAVGQALTKLIEDGLLDNMLACGLSEPLQQALVDISHYVSPIESIVQEKLLDLLSLVLCGRPFKPVGCPDNRLPPIPAFAKEWQQAGIHHGDAEIALALNTLGSFDFKGLTLNEFVRDVAIRYIKNPNPDIRKAAALTCCQIYIEDPIIMQTSFHALGIVRSVVTQLISAAVGDPDPEIRRQILYALDTKFDRHLAEQQNVRKVLIALNDPDFEVRKAAMEVLGRLTTVNPGYIYPPLRKSLQNFTMSVSTSEDTGFEEEGARLVSLCAIHAPPLVQPFVSKLIDIFLPKAQDANSSVAAVMIRAIGDLATLGGSELESYIPRLMPVLVDAIQDLSSPTKREAALRAMGQLASHSGYVIQPYLDYPYLLDLLTGIIKNEQQGSIRRETIKLLGVLGALDPYKHQQSLETATEMPPSVDALPMSDVALIMQGLAPSNEEYYPQVVMNTLLNNVLKDSSLSQYHNAVIEAIVSIFKTLGLKCVSFLPQIIPTFISVMQAAQPTRLEQYFNQLAILVSIVREHIRNYNDDLVELVREYWTTTPSVQITTLSLVESLARALGHDFYPSMVKLLPLMMKVLEFDPSQHSQTSIKILHTVLIFGHHAEQSMWLVLPKLVRVFQNPSKPANVRKTCIETLGTIVRQTNVSDFTALILAGLREVLSSKNKEIRTAAYDCILTFFFQYPDEMDPFVEGIKIVLLANGIATQHFEFLSARYRNGEPLPQDLRPDADLKTFAEDNALTDITLRKLPVNQEHLKMSWEAHQKSTREDWQEWMRRFSIELLKESPSNALRACAQLASVYPPLAKDLFNSAFVSCWTELYDQYQEDLVHSLEAALMSPQMPPEILQMLLNLAEFMEHDDKALPVDIGALGRYAAKCHAYAKALHYKELEFEEEKSQGVVEALIVINNQLQQSDAAVGILRNAQKYRDFELKETWFERLGRWDEALDAYNSREDDEGTLDVTMGKMRCLHALGEWETLSSLAQDKWSLASIENKRMIAPLAAAAAWGLSQWELMEDYLKALKTSSPDRSFFGAIAAIHRNEFLETHRYIEKARDGLDTELSALLAESYTRAYNVVVRVQMLTELEEIVAYKKSANQPEKQLAMRDMWKTRLQGCEGNVETWQRMLKVRALVLAPQDNIELWIKFANLCRKSSRTALAEKTLSGLQDVRGDDMGSDTLGIPEVTYAQHKYRWAMGEQARAMIELQDFTNDLADRCSALSQEVQNAEASVHSSMNIYHQGKASDIQTKKAEINKTKVLLSKCYLRLGRWRTDAIGSDWTSEQTREILLAYNSAAEYNPMGYKAWHAWALANFEIVNARTSHAQHHQALFPPAAIVEHVIPAIRGFLKSIALSQAKSTLQDTLRLLTLWFAHGANADVRQALAEGFPLVSMGTWLEVIPQLIARINQPNPGVRHGVQKLLCDLGRMHPQALMFPLTVAMKSSVRGRADSAKAVMDELRTHSRDLVDQAQLVSKELIRVAVLWHELWHEGCEEASRLFFGDHDTEGMFRVLAPLHKLLEDGPQTLREISFQQAFGRELQEAKAWCERYRETGDPGDVNQAWDLYHSVYKRIDRQLGQLIQLDLKYISPALESATDLEVAVPGTYQAGKPIIRIQSFNKVFTVIASKQRPRKMMLRGSDGQLYTYLVKGHEDIRQDERVMQLFGLVNTLLGNDVQSFKRHLNIQRFPAVPLSQNSGILGWVPNSDTFHNLIKEYREHRRILINIEHRIMLQMAPQFDNLTLMQKVEVFNYAMDNTTGKDLYRVLWLKSRSSEAWLARRTTYTRSLAVMSMVGYILGLGDRHPSNLMLDRTTGQVVHIDFGDCFEVAMHREKYPERVPFRLTRMLTSAMEISNIDGTFKISSEAAMRVLRQHRESLLAVLEAFIHDPLLNWRLTARESPLEPGFRSERRESLLGGVGGPGAAAGASGPREAGSFMRELEQAQQQQQQPAAVAAAAAAAAVGGGGSSGRRGSSTTPAGAVAGSGLAVAPRGRGRAGTLAGAGSTGANPAEEREVQNARALQVLARVKEKLHGTDFRNLEPLDVETQVAKLIAQATNIENTCQHYIGWCSFW